MSTFRGNVVCLVNRTDAPLDVLYDGKTFVLDPGENHVPSELVRFAKNQHPIMGTAHPYAPTKCEYKVGVKVNTKKGEKQRDPLTPLTADMLKGIERIDRSQLFDQGAKATPVNTGNYVTIGDVKVHGGGSAGFAHGE